MADSFITTLVTGGVGATLGGIATALVQVVSKKGETRARAADIVADAAGGLADRLNHLNEGLEVENRQLRQTMRLLTAAVDEVLHEIESPSVLKLRKANNAAKLSL